MVQTKVQYKVGKIMTTVSDITLPVAISMRTQPRLQMSAARPDLSEPVITSGAMNAADHTYRHWMLQTLTTYIQVTHTQENCTRNKSTCIHSVPKSNYVTRHVRKERMLLTSGGPCSDNCTVQQSS